MMRVGAKGALVFLALCELAVAFLYIFGDPSNPHSLANDPHVLRIAIMLPFILIVIAGVPLTLVILGWRFARRIGR
jgi:hypothetical protein